VEIREHNHRGNGERTFDNFIVLKEARLGVTYMNDGANHIPEDVFVGYPKPGDIASKAQEELF
jgi:hypothetical protein